jgi:phospholipid transport system substrate-binding protein
VRSEIRRDDGTRVPVNYVMRRTPDGWKAWDVVIEGISYVRNFRKDIGLEIDQRGLDAVITRLEAEAAGMEAQRRK